MANISSSDSHYACTVGFLMYMIRSVSKLLLLCRYRYKAETVQLRPGMARIVLIQSSILEAVNRSMSDGRGQATKYN